jgi:hypothetical protein
MIEYESQNNNCFIEIKYQSWFEFDYAPLVTGGIEMATLSGKGQQVFMAAIFAFDAGKAVVQIPAVEIININYLALPVN